MCCSKARTTHCCVQSGWWFKISLALKTSLSGHFTSLTVEEQKDDVAWCPQGGGRGQGRRRPKAAQGQKHRMDCWGVFATKRNKSCQRSSPKSFFTSSDLADSRSTSLKSKQAGDILSSTPGPSLWSTRPHGIYTETTIFPPMVRKHPKLCLRGGLYCKSLGVLTVIQPSWRLSPQQS